MASRHRRRTPKLWRLVGESNYRGLAAEFLVLSELARRGLDGTHTLARTKGIDILVLNRRTGRMFKVEVKSTRRGAQHSKIFGRNYCWLMDERHGHARAQDFLFCFVLLGRGTSPRFFLIPSREVAAYIRWEHPYFRRHSTRQTGKVTRMRVFRIPEEKQPDLKRTLPRWRDGRWARWENNWAIFGRALRKKGTGGLS